MLFFVPDQETVVCRSVLGQIIDAAKYLEGPVNTRWRGMPTTVAVLIVLALMQRSSSAL